MVESLAFVMSGNPGVSAIPRSDFLFASVRPFGTLAYNDKLLFWDVGSLLGSWLGGSSSVVLATLTFIIYR